MYVYIPAPSRDTTRDDERLVFGHPQMKLHLAYLAQVTFTGLLSQKKSRGCPGYRAYTSIRDRVRRNSERFEV